MNETVTTILKTAACQGPQIGECVRIAIIIARKRRITTEPEFLICLDEARRLLS